MHVPSSPMTHLPEQEWANAVQAAPQACRELVAGLARAHCAPLAQLFYNSMLGHPQAARFLNHDIVHRRLQASMERWICEVLAHPMTDPAAIVALQRHVGEVHARIQLPIHLVARGARVLKQALFEQLDAACGHEDPLHRQAIAYVSELLDMALELMTEAFLRNSQRGARNDEAYRLFSLGQNMSVERERQRSVLLEWGQELMFSLHRVPRPGVLPRLGSSEFGLWFHHKAATLFEGAPEMEQIRECIERVDATVLPRLAQAELPADQAAHLVLALQQELDNLKFFLSGLFEHQLEVENGRDALTRLLNRRFLPSVLNREIALSNSQGKRFALLLLDVDHFKQVNDEHGHDAGDLVLQQAAALLLNGVRNGDFVFRYGGEEMLVMLVEVDAESSLRIAENLRQRFADHEFQIGQGRRIGLTVSIGVALYDHHPDPQYLIRRADQAMYLAKNKGRNRVWLAAEQADD